MTEDFFLRALAGGIGVALASGPVGCFVVWRRMAYFGAALAHAVLLGVALGFLLEIEPTLAIFVMCLLLAGCLTLLERQRLVPLDTLLGVLAHGIFAAGLVVIAFMEQVRVDLMGYLLGDILSVSAVDLWFIYAIAAGSVAALAWQWRNLLAMTVNEDLAAVEGVPVGRMRILLVVLLAVVIAIGMKIVGMLLVLALVIIPAATARRIVTTPEQMVAAAAAIGAAAAAGGLSDRSNGTFRPGRPSCSWPARCLLRACSFLSADIPVMASDRQRVTRWGQGPLTVRFWSELEDPKAGIEAR